MSDNGQVTHRHKCPCGAEFEVTVDFEKRQYAHDTMTTLTAAHQQWCLPYAEATLLLENEQ